MSSSNSTETVSVATSSAPVAAAPPTVNQLVNNDEVQYADDGDGDFIPVVKEKRKSKVEKTGSGAGDKASGGAKGKSGSGSSRRRGRRSAASAAAAASSSGGGEQGATGNHEGGGSDNGTADEHSNDDTPKKFVEAPIPAVNVWKVSD